MGAVACPDTYAEELDAYRVRVAKALSLLHAAERLRVARVEALTASEGRLVAAIEEITAARDAAEAAGELVIETCRLVARVKAGLP